MFSVVFNTQNIWKKAASNISRLLFVASLSLCGQVSKVSSGRVITNKSQTVPLSRELGSKNSRSRTTSVRKAISIQATEPKRIGRVTYWVIPGNRAMVVSGKSITDRTVTEFSTGINLNFFNRATGRPVGVAKGIGVSQSDVVVTPSNNRGALAITKAGNVRVLSEANLHTYKPNLSFWSGWYPTLRYSKNGYTIKMLREELKGVTVNRTDALNGLDGYRKRDRLLYFISTKNNAIIPVIVTEATLPESLNIGSEVVRKHEINLVMIGDSGSAIRMIKQSNQNNIRPDGVYLVCQK